MITTVGVDEVLCNNTVKGHSLEIGPVMLTTQMIYDISHELLYNAQPKFKDPSFPVSK